MGREGTWGGGPKGSGEAPGLEGTGGAPPRADPAGGGPGAGPRDPGRAGGTAGARRCGVGLDVGDLQATRAEAGSRDERLRPQQRPRPQPRLSPPMQQAPPTAALAWEPKPGPQRRHPPCSQRSWQAPPRNKPHPLLSSSPRSRWEHPRPGRATARSRPSSRGPRAGGLWGRGGRPWYLRPDGTLCTCSQESSTGGGMGVLTVVVLMSPIMLSASFSAWYMRSISSRR